MRVKKPAFRIFLTLVLAACTLLAGNISCKKDTARWIMEKQGVRMREVPDTNGKLIALIPYASKVELISEKGESLTIAGATGKWSEVKWNEKKGWVFGGFLGRIDPVAAEGEAVVNGVLDYFEKTLKNDSKKLDEILNNPVRIGQKMGNFVSVYTGPQGETAGAHLFVKEGGTLRRIPLQHSPMAVTIVMLNLNNDNLVDVIIQARGREAESPEPYAEFTAYLGKTETSVEKGDRVRLQNSLGSDDVILGRCEKFQINGLDYDSGEGMKKIVVTFDCETNRFKTTYK